MSLIKRSVNEASLILVHIDFLGLENLSMRQLCQIAICHHLLGYFISIEVLVERYGFAELAKTSFVLDEGRNDVIMTLLYRALKLILLVEFFYSALLDEVFVLNQQDILEISSCFLCSFLAQPCP